MKLPALIACLLMSSSIAFAQEQSPKINTKHLVGNVYVHTSYGKFGNTLYPANGLYIVTNQGIVLIDTPWGEEQTQQLIDTLAKRYHQKITLCISTHYHEDRTGGIDVLKAAGTKTYSSNLTRELCKQKGMKKAEYVFTGDTTFKVGNFKVQTYYPGAGHTVDNLVVWLPQYKILYGGCLIKSMESKDIGNTADADVKAWPVTIKKVREHFNNVRYVIPGHQGWQGGLEQLGYTLDLLEKK